jgi:hypothetical protein
MHLIFEAAATLLPLTRGCFSALLELIRLRWRDFSRSRNSTVINSSINSSSSAVIAAPPERTSL